LPVVKAGVRNEHFPADPTCDLQNLNGAAGCAARHCIVKAERFAIGVTWRVASTAPV
jgi:hypothetical protein